MKKIVILSLFLLLFVWETTSEERNQYDLFYQISSIYEQKTPWNLIGTFSLNKNQIVADTNANEFRLNKHKLIQELTNPFDYIIFKLCTTMQKTQCIQTYVPNYRIKTNDNFLISIGVDSTYTPYIINYKTFEKTETEVLPEFDSSVNLNRNVNSNDMLHQTYNPNSTVNNFKIFANLIVIITPSISEPINIESIIPSTHKKVKNKETDAELNQPKSFFRKYWYAILIFFISLSISKHFSENLQETINAHNNATTQAS